MRHLLFVALFTALVGGYSAAADRPLGEHRGLYGVVVPLKGTADPQRVAQAAADCGASAVMIAAGWPQLEPKPHLYDWIALDELTKTMAKAGMQVLLSIHDVPGWASEPTPAELELFAARGLTPHAGAIPPRLEHLSEMGDFWAALARRYAGTASGYEIFPAPDGAGFLTAVRNHLGELVDVSFEPKPALYAQLLDVAASSIRAVDQKTLIISGGLTVTDSCDFAKTLIELGALESVDMVGVQLWSRVAEGDDAAWQWLARTRETLVSAGLAEKPLCVTAWGFVEDEGSPKNAAEGERAEAVARQLSQMGEHPYVTGAFYCALSDGGSARGLYDAQLSPRQAAARFKSMAEAPAVYISVSMPELFYDSEARGEITVANETDSPLELAPQSDFTVEGAPGLTIALPKKVSVEPHSSAVVPFLAQATRPEAGKDEAGTPTTATFTLRTGETSRSASVEVPRPTEAPGAPPAAPLPSEPSLLPRAYVAKRLAAPVTVDGKGDDWEGIPWTDPFVPSGSPGAVAARPTRAKLAWDDEALYVLAEMDDREIEATRTAHDSAVWEENAFALMVDPSGAGKEYLQLAVSALGTTADLHVVEPGDGLWLDAAEWEPQGWTSAVGLAGTANDPSDIDTGWTVEMRVPFDSLGARPEPGAVWRLQMRRFDGAESAAWSPSPGDRAQEAFGELFFADKN